MTQVVGIRFERAGKIYYFSTGDLKLTNGDRVIVESSKGQDMGTVVTQPHDIDETTLSTPLRPVMRPATIADEQRAISYKEKEAEVFDFCLEQIEVFKLPMKLIRAEYSYDGSRLVYYFSANGRVDFRELVKALAAKLHTRIELRQIGVRDEARLVGGYSTCGRELCCAAFLENFRPVSIKMAKQQNIALNPAKISGVCGRLMCCLSYEKDCEDEMNCRKCKAEAAKQNGESSDTGNTPDYLAALNDTAGLEEMAALLDDEFTEKPAETQERRDRKHHKNSHKDANKDSNKDANKEASNKEASNNDANKEINKEAAKPGREKTARKKNPARAKDSEKSAEKSASKNTTEKDTNKDTNKDATKDVADTAEQQSAAKPGRSRRPRPRRSQRTKVSEPAGEGDKIVTEE